MGEALNSLRMSKALNKKYYRGNCQICETEVAQAELQSLNNCNHLFCSSCLQQYVIYKIKIFEEVECPDESCRLILDEKSQVYLELPLDLRKQYKKIKQYEISKQPGKRLCPREECDGVMDISNEELDPVCPDC